MEQLQAAAAVAESAEEMLGLPSPQPLLGPSPLLCATTSSSASNTPTSGMLPSLSALLGVAAACESGNCRVRWSLIGSLAQSLLDTSFEAQRRALPAEELSLAASRAERLLEVVREIATCSPSPLPSPPAPPLHTLSQRSLFTTGAAAATASSAVAAATDTATADFSTTAGLVDMPPQLQPVVIGTAAEMFGMSEPARKRRGRPPGKRPEACGNCGATSTPEWRRGDTTDGAKNVPLCNACGLQLAKKRKTEREAKMRGSIASVLNPPTSF